MIPLVIGLSVVSLVIALIVSAVLVRLGHRLRTYDNAGVPGQVKAEVRKVPNTGGIAIFSAIAFPTLAILLASMLARDTLAETPIAPHLEGIADSIPLAIAFLVSASLLHVMGLIDDRHPLPWQPKLLVTMMISMSLI